MRKAIVVVAICLAALAGCTAVNEEFIRTHKGSGIITYERLEYDRPIFIHMQPGGKVQVKELKAPKTAQKVRTALGAHGYQVVDSGADYEVLIRPRSGTSARQVESPAMAAAWGAGIGFAAGALTPVAAGNYSPQATAVGGMAGAAAGALLTAAIVDAASHIVVVELVDVEFYDPASRQTQSTTYKAVLAQPKFEFNGEKLGERMMDLVANEIVAVFGVNS